MNVIKNWLLQQNGIWVFDNIMILFIKRDITAIISMDLIIDDFKYLRTHTEFHFYKWLHCNVSTY